MKKLAIAALVLLALLAVGVWYVLSHIDALVARVIEEQGTRLTGTAVTVRGVDISLTEGRGSIRGLAVANPEGFSSGNAVSLEEITVQIDLESLGAPPYRLKEVTIGAPEVHYELDARARSNVQTLLDHVQAASPEKDPGAAEPGPTGEPVRLRIDRFHFADGVASADAEALGGEKGEVKLPPLTRTDLAGTPGEIGQQVLGAYLGVVVRQVAKGQLGEQLDRALEDAGDAVRKLFE